MSRFRVGIGEEGKDVGLQLMLDRGIGAACGGPVGVNDRPAAAYCFDMLILAEDVAAEGSEIFFEGLHGYFCFAEV